MPKKQYRTKRVYLRKGKTAYDIPVDDDGFVPESELLKRFNSNYAGVPDGRSKRDILKDYEKRADIVLSGRVTPEQAAAWWDRPGKIDIEGIDCPGPAKEVDGMKFHGTRGEAVKMAQMIRATSDPSEVEKIRKEGTEYSARPLKRGIKGRYIPARNTIDLSRRSGLEHQTVAHETTHMMRHRDTSRKNTLVKSNPVTAIEESCTVAEQMARSRMADYDTGYYWDVPVYDEKTKRWRKPTDREAVRMAEEDYMTLTYGRGKPLKGSEAKRSVEENWSKTNIARLKIGRGPMAISSVALQDRSFESAAKEIRDKGHRSKGVLQLIAPKHKTRKSRTKSGRKHEAKHKKR